MKKLFLAGLLFALLAISGCSHIKADSGYAREAYTNGEGKTYFSSNFDGGVGLSLSRKPQNLGYLMRTEADSYAIKKDADTRQKLIEGMREGKVKESELFVLQVTNNDSKHGVYFFHPEISGMKIYAKAKGGFAIAEVTKIPDELVLYADNGIWKKERVDKRKAKTPKHRNGIRIDYEIVVNKINDK
jgi:hypothetical protein